MEQWPTAVDYLKRCLLASSPHESHVRKAYALLVGCLTHLNLDAEVRQTLDRGQELFPDDAELHFRRGILEQHARNYDRAIAAYQAALSDRGERCFSSRDHGITGFKACHNLAGIYRETSRLDLAELQWRLALAEQPTYRDGWRGLVESLLDQEKHVTLEVEIEAAKTNGFPPDEIACAEAQLAIRRGNIPLAIDVLETAIETQAEIVEPLRLKCQLLFENSSVDRAIAALEELCRQCPADGAAWHNLGIAHEKASHVDLAISCYEKSLAVRPDSRMTARQLDDVRKTQTRSEAACLIAGKHS
jgi:tetratricopeptide (TPR) repeat protein